MITISQRTCTLGIKYSGKHTEASDKTPERKTLKISLEGIELDETEFNAIFQSPHAWRLLHDDNLKEARKPSLDLLRRFELKGLTLEGAHVVLWYGLGTKKIELRTARITKVAFELCNAMASNATTMSLAIEGEPAMDASLVELLDRIGLEIECEIRADHPASQQDLPLNKHGEGEQPAHKSGKGRGRKFSRAVN